MSTLAELEGLEAMSVSFGLAYAGELRRFLNVCRSVERADSLTSDNRYSGIRTRARR